MKGISPVIAVILLLLITVAIVGLSFGFFSRITTQTSQTTEQQVTQQVQQMSKVIQIDAQNDSTVVIRNVGSATIQYSEMGVYINGTAKGCTWTPSSPTEIAAGTTASCYFIRSCLPPSTKLKVVSPANSIEITCV